MSNLSRVTATSILALFLFASCSDKGTGPVASINVVCEANGLCECTSNLQCASGELCYNGKCRKPLSDADIVTGHDGGPGELVTADAILPGAFKSPCSHDDECNSGVCLEVATGVSVCSLECIDDCPEDWECRGVSLGGTLLSFYCFPPLDRLCQACKTDVSCTGSGNLCLDISGVLSCGRDCSSVACPNGYDCLEVTSVEGVVANQCVPINGHCQCTPENANKAFSCTVSNDSGSCQGQQICQEDGAMTACDAPTPEPEQCDDKDNDCDGFVDEQVDLDSCTVENEFGTCVGQRVCNPGKGESCTAPIPAPETCDTLDNDCDGVADEDFKDADGNYGLLEHCGACNQNCLGKFAHAGELACDLAEGEATCKLISCETGYVLAQGSLCLPPIHHLCEPCTGHEACVGANDKCLQMNPADTQTFCGRDCGLDNEYQVDCPTGYDCQEVVVDGDSTSQCVPTNSTCDCSLLSQGQVKPCQSANDFGTCYGVATCDPDQGWADCSAKIPSQELCDGFDNDCDGLIDEGLTGDPCEVENDFGTCLGSSVCKGQDGVSCTAAIPSQELCDGMDNDCDGGIDEDFATNILGDDGQVVSLVYDFHEAHCGGCKIPCQPTGAALAVECAGNGGVGYCKVTACKPGYYVYEGKACLPIPQATLCLPCQADEDCLGPADSCLSYESGDFCGRDCSQDSLYSVGAPGDPGYCSGTEGEQGCCPGGYLCQQGQCRRESNDCACDAPGKLQPCQVANDQGTCQGYRVCVPAGPDAGWLDCNALTPAQEICDGIDNDCDGLIDGLDDSVATDGLVGFPACENVSEACSGEWLCAPLAGLYQWTCTAPIPNQELCNGLDDDCDGEVDETFTKAGAFTLLEHCGRCGLDCRSALAHLALAPDGTPAKGAVTCELVAGEPVCVPQLCAAGFYPFPATGTASVCLALEAGNCQPCGSVSDCPGIGHGCLAVSDDPGSFCLSRCDAASPFPGCQGQPGAQGCCPDGYVCSDVPGTPQGELYCTPIADTCKCGPDNVGLNRPCTVSQGVQTCFGISSCQAAPGGLFSWSDCDTGANVEVCDGIDNDCDGTIDDGFLVDGAYASDENCGSCGKNCLAKWSLSEQHATGACDPGFPGGPECVIGECASLLLGAGIQCHSHAECTGLGAGAVCLAAFGQCARPCGGDADCPDGSCVAGSCAASCTGDGDCLQFSSDAFCSNGACVTQYDYVDLDGWTGNGCECAATNGLALDDPDTFAVYPLAGASYRDADCDGIDGDLETAVFVVAGLQGGNGSYETPFGTIQEAVDAFSTNQHSHILVSTGVYVEQVVLKAGVRIYGGYAPDFMDRDIVFFPTVLAGPIPDFGNPGWLPGTLYASGINVKTVVAGLTIVGYDVPATDETSGQDAVAVFIASASDQFILTNNAVIGGKAGPGADGAPGAAGADGGNGGIGLHSAECTNTVTCIGNNCNEKTCAGHVQPGGNGGLPGGGCQAGDCGNPGCAGMEAEGAESPQKTDAPAPGCTYPAGANSATYSGGPWNHCKYDCFVSSNMVGNAGFPGGDGTGGTGGPGAAGGIGDLVAGAWSAPAASPGSNGTGGTGGGGGSSGAYISNNKSNSCTIGNPRGDLGGSGGGGGAGGNGGQGGAAGDNGGASIAIFLGQRIAGSHATVLGNLITRGPGGKGGRGGNGGTGGKGGPGGFGGSAGWPAWCAGVGGPGGRGGDGGPGGGGGGGSGGASLGIAAIAGDAADFAANTFLTSEDLATGGPGGSGGQCLPPATPGSGGNPGGSSNVEVF